MAAAVQPSAAVATINDGHHPHPLFLRTKPRMFKCDRCKCDGFGQRYICRQCKVCFHESCATCPESIEFFMHPNHTLTLQRSYNPFTHHKCEVCGDPAHGYFYRCKPCSFELHPFCSLLQRTINYKAHPGHTLGYANGEKAPCMVCGEECVGWRYMCQECPAHVHMKCLGMIRSVGDDSGEEGAKKGSKGKKAKMTLKIIGGFGVVLAAILAVAAGEGADVNFDFGDLEMEGGDFDFEVEEEVELELEAVSEVAAAVKAELEIAAVVEAEAKAEGEDNSDNSDDEEGNEEEEEKNEERKEEEEDKNKKKSHNPFKSFLKDIAKGIKRRKIRTMATTKRRRKMEDKEKN